MTVPEHPRAQPEASDADLIRLVRAGDAAAYEQLFLRHRDVAIRYARRIADSERAEDLCAEAFTKILDLLQRGKGPDVAFRAYLLTTVRTSHLNTIRSGSREDLVPDHEPISRMLPHNDDPDARFDASAIHRAFSSLPHRWQAALWLTSVEGLSNEEASRHLDIKVNAVASLAFRARAGLRQAYLSEHLLETTDPRCRRVIELLPSYARGTLTDRRSATVEVHLETCAPCTAAALELSEVDSRLGALLAPLALTGLTAGAVIVPAKATSLLAAVKGLLPGLVGTKVAVAATVTAVGVAAGTVVLRDPPDVGAAPPTSGRVSSTDRVLSPAKPDPVPTATSMPRPRPVAPRTTLVRSRSVPSAPRPPAPVSTLTPTTTPAPTTTPPPTTKPTSVPTPSPSAPPVPEAQAAKMGVEQPSAQRQTIYGQRWEHVTVAVTQPAENTFLTLTTTRSYSAALAQTSGTGWVCGTPVLNWFDGGLYATTRISCMYTGNGDGGPLRFAYRVVSGSLFTATLTPPTGYHHADLGETVRTLLLPS